MALPIGISFFTFQALSYIADVYTKHCPAERSIVRFGMYHSLFPQLIAGPIVRYVEIRSEIAFRSVSLIEITEGMTRFVVGLAKKVIIADHAGQIADAIFGLDAAQLTPSTAWLGAIAYGIQILFDFAGYSDMAIGLGRLLGFHFPENFADPYLSRSVTEFWRRWNMTLSRWFRDYLYIPLGGNRKGPLRTYVNLVVVFFLCGLWHGAGYTFIAWGLFHGAFLAGERFVLHRWAIVPRGVLGQIYTLVAVTVGWVLFRSGSFAQATDFLKEMLFMEPNGPGWAAAQLFLPRDRAFYLLLGDHLGRCAHAQFHCRPGGQRGRLPAAHRHVDPLGLFGRSPVRGHFQPVHLLSVLIVRVAIDRIFVLLFAAILAAPLLQMATHLVHEPLVEELRQPHTISTPLARLITMNSRLSDDVNGWFNDHFGFRSVLIRLKNEVDYQLFRLPTKSLSAGKAGCSIKGSPTLVKDATNPTLEKQIINAEFEICAIAWRGAISG